MYLDSTRIGLYLWCPNVSFVCHNKPHCIVLKGFEQKPHLTVVLPSLGWAQSYVPAFSALIRPAIKFLHWDGQVWPVSLGQAKYILESPVNHLNHWCEKLRDRSQRGIYPIYMTKDIRSLFCSDRFKTMPFFRPPVYVRTCVLSMAQF